MFYKAQASDQFLATTKLATYKVKSNNNYVTVNAYSTH